MSVTPMLHPDEHIRSFLVGEKEGGSEFTTEDEEVVLSVPDGRSVTTLVNATPVQVEGGRSNHSSSTCRTWHRLSSWGVCGPSS